jgi:hypothetical protein
MAAERQAAAARLADAHATAHADAHCRNIEVARATTAASEQRLAQADRAGGLTMVAAEHQHCKNQYPWLCSTHGPSDRRNAAPSPPSSTTPSAAIASVCQRRVVASAGWFLADQASSIMAHGRLMTHKYRGSQQSSRKVLPKFIDSTQREPKNICKP